MSDKLKGQIRHVVLAGLAFAVGKGWIPEHVAADLATYIVGLGVLIWSWVSKKQPAEPPK
jgi:predicted membrane-bound spermidine synthase